MSFFEFPHSRTYDSDLGWLMSKYPEIAENAARAAASEEAAKASEEAAAASAASALASADEATGAKNYVVSAIQATTEELNARLSEAIAGATPTDTELQDVRVWYDGSTSQTAGDAVRGQVEYVMDMIGDFATTGSNMFDAENAKRGYMLDTSGVEQANSAFYCSRFMPVKPSTQYYVNANIGSGAQYSVLYYDANRGFLSGTFVRIIGGYTVTTPSNAAYMRVNGTVARISEQFIGNADATDRNAAYGLVVDGKNTTGILALSAKDVSYNRSAGTLSSVTEMIIKTQDNLYSFGTSVNVGVGKFLWFNKTTGTLFASNTWDMSEDVYFVTLLSAADTDYRRIDVLKYCFMIDSAYPIFKVDLLNNKLYVNVKDTPAYLINNGNFYTIPVMQQELTLYPHGFVYYDFINSQFVASNSFADLNRGYPVMARYYTGVYARADIEYVTDGYSYEQYVCYGDSLTWYDGNAFTWGPHQGETCVGFESYIKTYLQAKTVANRGVSGQTTPQICARIETATDLANFDYLMIMGGDNDGRLGVELGTLLPPGSTFDTSTTIGALQSAIEYALTQNTNLRIILMTEPIGWTYTEGEFRRVTSLIPDSYRRVAELYALPIIDLWNESGINELTRTTYYADPAPAANQLYMYHPNNDGWLRLSRIIINRIKEL